MRATELFANQPDWSFEDDAEWAEAAREALGDDLEIEGLRLIEIEDHDLATMALDAMDSGELTTLDASAEDDLQSLLVVPEDGYSVRMALIDGSSKSAARAIEAAMLGDVDLIVVGPYDAQNATLLSPKLTEAARTGHGVFTLGTLN